MRHPFTAFCMVSALALSMGNNALACEPLVVFYSGFSSQLKGNLLWKLCQRYSKPGVTKHCVSWQDDDTGFIKEHWRSTRNATPIVLVGHSYGGDTAYHVAAELPQGYAPTLITLDPVGEIAWDTLGIPFIIGGSWRDQRLPKPTPGKWVNIHRRASNSHYWIGGQIQLSGQRSCNSIANAGGVWGNQRNATSIAFDGDHCDVGDMFKLAEPAIAVATRCLAERQSLSDSVFRLPRRTESVSWSTLGQIRPFTPTRQTHLRHYAVRPTARPPSTAPKPVP